MYTLLIADDEADERTLIRFLLKKYENTFHILEAQNGRDALDLLNGTHVDILLSDIQMPFINGIDLVSMVKEKNPDIEVLFFSGYDDFSYVKAALSLTGCTLNKYIKQIRMEKAQELLLNTNMKVSDISQAVGYPNTSYFCKSFQKLFGTTPERFRQGEPKPGKDTYV